MTTRALALLALLTACNSSPADPADTAAPAEVAAPDASVAEPSDASSAESDAPGPDAASVNPECAPCPGLVGTALRIAGIYVTSPDSPVSTADDAIRDFLNEMWARDMDMGLINMVFVIRGYDPAAGVLAVEQGPAWLHPDGRYHFICGYNFSFSAPFDAQSCRYDGSPNPSTVCFHAGPGDAPNTCAPDGDPPHSITLGHAITSGHIAVDCAARDVTFSDGLLSGFMHVDDAYGVCACMQFDEGTGSYACDRTPDPDSAVNFCFQRCGKGFALLGQVFEKVAKVTPVAGPDGVPSFPLGGTFTAETIPNFAEGCCRGVNDCDP